MDLAMDLAHRFKVWVKCRPQLDIYEGATWLLLSFVYAQSLSMEALGFKFSGIIPVFTVPQLSLVTTLLCLAFAVLVLIEPILPSKVCKRINDARHSYFGEYFRQFSIFMAFIFGLATGVDLLTKKALTFSWLIDGVMYVGFVIFLVLLIKLLVMTFKLGASMRTEVKRH